MNMQPAGEAWTDERVTALKQLWADGLSASQIASELSDHTISFTRSAIIGKVHRLNLASRKQVSEFKIAKPKRERKPKAAAFKSVYDPKRIALATAQADAFVETFDAKQAMDAASIPIEQRRSLIDLTNDTCRWPFGDPQREGFFFCGAGGANFGAGRPYCPCHASIAGAGYPLRRDRRPESTSTTKRAA